MAFFTISLLNGISYGLLLFMLSAGLTLIFSMIGVLNFAHASFYMLGPYLGYSLTGWLGFWWALVLTPGLVGALGCASAICCAGPPSPKGVWDWRGPGVWCFGRAGKSWASRPMKSPDWDWVMCPRVAMCSPC
jgi:hypothetical protein